MKEIWQAVHHNTIFIILTVVSLALLIASFIVPPTGIIDPSVLAATGEIAGFFALWTVVLAIERGVDAKLQHGNTSVVVGDLNKEDNNPPQ